jgi:selenocysteine lyase/cysteine desulfurase
MHSRAELLFQWQAVARAEYAYSHQLRTGAAGKSDRRRINVVPSYRNFAIIDFDEKKVQWAIRASPHYYNTPEEIAIFLDAVESLV